MNQHHKVFNHKLTFTSLCFVAGKFYFGDIYYASINKIYLPLACFCESDFNLQKPL